mgnify:FL=1
MSGWGIFGIVIAVFVLIGCIPVGVDARYSQNELSLRLKIGLLQMQVLPAKPKKKQAAPEKKQEAPKKKQETAKQAAASQKPEATKKKVSMPKLTLADILELVNLACDMLGDLRRKLRVEILTLHVVLGADDPAKAAMQYGGAWAVIGMLDPKLDRLFVIKKRDIQPILDYNENETKISAQLALTITIGRALSLGLKAGVRFLKLWIHKKKAVQQV